MKRRLLCITMLLVMLIGTIPISAKTKSEKINDYLETSFDVYNVPIVNSYLEFRLAVENKELTPAIQDTSKSQKTPYTIKAKKNGCLVVYSYSYANFYDETDQLLKNINGQYNIPIRKNDKITIRNQSSAYDLVVYIGFIPEEKIFNIDESVKNANGTLTFTFGNVYGNGTELSVYATKQKLSTTKVLSNDILSNTKNIAYDCTSILTDDGDAIITFPESGKYTIVTRTAIKDSTYSRATFILDTDKYINPTLDTLEEPISAVSGTNIIVGYGEPSATVYAEYDGKKYEGKANRYGIYKIKLKVDMKEGKQFKIWQSKNNLTSKKTKYRVTDID